MECDKNFDFGDPETHHAQFEINDHTSRNISDSKVQLTKVFEQDYDEMEYGVEVQGSVVLANGHLLMTNCKKNHFI